MIIMSHTLYCFHCSSRYTYPDTKLSAINAAKKEGWIVLGDDTCICPECRKELKING